MQIIRSIQNRIYELRGERVMLDADLAALYDTETKALNLAVKRNVKRFRSIYVPHGIAYGLCFLWEKYSHWSKGQLPPAYNRKFWHASWKRTRYSNAKLKSRLGWRPSVSTDEGLRRHFESCRTGESHA